MPSLKRSNGGGPVNRNFGGNAPRKAGSIRLIFAALIAASVGLALVAMGLSRRVMSRHSAGGGGGYADEPPAGIRVHQKHAKDRRGQARDAVREKIDGQSKLRAGGSGGNEPMRGSGTPAKLQTADGKPRVDENGMITPPRNPDHDGHRVYCMVPFIWNQPIHAAIMETWGKRCDEIYFLTDSIVGGELRGDVIGGGDADFKPYWEYPPNTFPDNVVFVNMTRTWNDCPETTDRRGNKAKKVCRHIWEKMWRSWVWVEENHLDRAEWFCKVDYDTFFFPENVKYFVHTQQRWDPLDEYHYFGHKINHRVQGREPMIAGATACWSRATLRDIARVYRDMPKGSGRGERGKCEDRAQATEEASTSLCLARNLNVTAEPARDGELREYITIAKYKDVLTWNRTEQGEWWYWKGKPKGAGEMEDTIAVRPIGLHKYKQPGEILDMNMQFFGPNARGNRNLASLDPRSRRFVDKVRKAMGVDPE